MRLLFVLAAAGLTIATSAPAAEPRVVSNPDWDARPTGEMLATAYPEAPMSLRIEGRATVRCDVSDLGVLENCEQLSETPAGMGFGRAALSLTDRFRMKPRTIDGEPVAGGQVRIPIRFTMPAGSPAPPVDPPSVSAQPARLAAARRTWNEVELADNIASMLREGASALQFEDAAPELADEARQALAEAGGTVAPKWAAALLTHYAATFDDAELSALAEFARTPGGKAWLVASIRPPVRLEAAIGGYAAAVSGEARRIFCAGHPCAVDMLRIAAARADATIVDPTWLQVPSSEQIAIAQPRLTMVMLVGGLVRLNCRANAYGVPENCRVEAETPLNLGFGQAALRLAPYFKLSPALIGLGAARETVSFVVPFPGANLPGAPTMPTLQVPEPAAAQATAFEVAELQLRASNAGERFLMPILQPDPNDSMPPAARAAAWQAIRSAARNQLRWLAPPLAERHAAAMSSTELAEIAAFLRTPMGQRIATLEPKEAERLEAINAYYAEAVARLAGRNVCKRRGCDPPPAAAAEGVTP